MKTKEIKMDIVEYFPSTDVEFGRPTEIQQNKKIEARRMSREHFTRLVEELSFRGIDPAEGIEGFSDIVTSFQEFFFANDSSSANTKRIYNNAIEQLKYWLEEYQAYPAGVIPLPMSVDLCCEYISWRATECPALRGGNSQLPYHQRVELAEERSANGEKVKRGVSKNTLALDVYAIGRLHQASCLPSPTTTQTFKLVHKNLLSQKVANKEISDQQTFVFTENHLGQVNKHCRNSEKLLELRDAAILNVNFEAMLRGIEATTLEISDIELLPCGSVNLRLFSDKTNKSGIPRYLSLSKHCMTFVTTYLNACGRDLTSDGYLFAAISSNNKTRHNNKPVSRDCIEGAFSRAHAIYTDAASTGVIDKFTTHSSRIGAAIWLVEQGATIPEVLNNGRWRSLAMLTRYIERYSSTGAMHRLRKDKVA